MVELRALTSLRGLAAFYVVLLHFSTAAERHATGSIPSLAPRGYLAVDFFFVLSGFIMAYSYAAEFQRLGPLRAMPSFLLKRVARLMPLHWFITFALLAYTLVVSPGFSGGTMPAFNSAQPMRDVVLNLVLLQGLGLAPNMNGPSWSISVEMFAYLAFPLFMLLVFSPRPWVRWAVLALALAAMTATALQGPQLTMETKTVVWTFTRGFSEFLLGMVVYSVFSTRPGAARAGSDGFLIAMLAIAGAMMLLRLWDLVAVLTFPLIILGIAYNNSRVAKVLNQRFLYFMGVISFSLYMVHYPIAYLELGLLKQLHPEPLSRPAAMLWALMGSLTTIPLAWVTYKCVEYPGRDAIRSLAQRFSLEAGKA